MDIVDEIWIHSDDYEVLKQEIRKKEPVMCGGNPVKIYGIQIIVDYSNLVPKGQIWYRKSGEDGFIKS